MFAAVRAIAETRCNCSRSLVREALRAPSADIGRSLVRAVPTLGSSLDILGGRPSGLRCSMQIESPIILLERRRCHCRADRLLGIPGVSPGDRDLGADLGVLQIDRT